MKKSLLLLFVSLAFWATAQPPQNFSYQAAIRNSAGAVLADQNVTIRISLTNQSESQLFLVETHQTTSNAQGVVGIAIGSGTLVSGSFTAIPWGTNQIYIKTEVQTQQSGSFVDLGTTQLLSVPYALFAADGNQGAAGADGRTVLNGTSNPQSTLGTNGDFYINTTTNTLFGPKVGTNWGTGVLLVGPQGPQGTAGATGATGAAGAVGATGSDGAQGAAGADGRTVLNGISTPQSTLGTDGDFYINTTTNTLFGPKVGTNWGTGVLLVGPQGPQGTAGATGATGAAGAVGATGSDGAQGAAGADGRTVLNGISTPQSTLGTDGDFYINTATSTLFGPKVGTNWGTGVLLVGPQGPQGTAGATGATGAAGAVGATGSDGAQGAAGADGRTVLNGISTPQSTLGTDGDFYINTTTNTLFGPKVGTNWGTGVLLVGPQGPQGTAGATGATGAAGAVGATGSDGAQGAAGADGRTVLNGISTPQSTLGTDGDFYINTATSTLFGPKVGTNWGTGVLLVGPQGPQGTAGATGATGTNGISVHWLGTFASHPGSPTLNQAYYNSTDKKSYVYNGTIWQIITQDGADAVSAVTGTGTAGKIAVWSDESVLTNIESFNIDPNVEVISDPAAGIDDPIFEVKNKDGKVVFGVYQSGVRIYVDDTETKAAKGGFAIGGLSNSTKVDEGIYFRVTPDSVRVLLRESSTKAAKGGFAIGGLSNSTKSAGQDLFFINSDSARIYINTDNTKAAKGGFAIGGLSNSTKALGEEYLRITRDSARINVDNSGTKAAKGGFAIGGLSTGKSQTESFMFLTPENYFIGHESGSNILPSGLYNSTLGYQTGKALTTGRNNIFVGYLAGSSNSTGGNNVFLGNYAGFLNNASNNVFLGNESGRYNTSGISNAFMGYYAGRMNTTGGYNVFIGDKAGTTNTTGGYNTFLGFNSGMSSTTSTENVYVGYRSGASNTDGKYNVLIGSIAGGTGTSFESCVYIGRQAGYAATGNHNVMVGPFAGGSGAITGSDNVFLGNFVAQNITGDRSGNTLLGSRVGLSGGVGNNNTLVGHKAGENMSGYGDYNVLIGYRAGYYLTGSSKLIIASAENTNIPLIYGEFDNAKLAINTTNPTQTLDVNGTVRVRSIGSGAYSTAVSRTSDGTLTTSTSDIRLKENISTLSGSLAKVMALRGVNFTWKSEPGMGNRVGFIAQEVEKVVPELVFTNSEDGYMGVNYAEMTAVLVEAMKELKQENNDLRMRVEQLEKLFEQK